MLKETCFGLGALLLTASAIPLLSGCDMARNDLQIDRAADLNVQDFRDAFAPRPILPAQDEAGVPDLVDYVAEESETLRPMPLVSVQADSRVPLKDVLYELARQTDYDVELDPRISGTILFTAREKPLDVVVERISRLAGLRFSFDDDVLRVELDTPYHKTYKIDYLNIVRETTGSMNTNISVVSGDGADTGSDYSMSSKGQADFWGNLEMSLEAILNADQRAASLKTNRDPSVQTLPPSPVPVEPLPGSSGSEDGDGSTASAPPPAVLNIQALPTDPQSDDEENKVEFTPGFSVNRQAGIITVYANEAMHKRIADYLQEIRRSVTAQVLIEAKILEVSLFDEFSAGVNWQGILEVGNTSAFVDMFSRGAVANGVLQPGGVRPSFQTGQSTLDFTAGILGTDFDGILEAISRFGTVRALASPRLMVLNNHASVLNVAENDVYFDIDIDVTTQDNTVSTEIDSTVRNVPEGVLVNVQPSIDLEAGTITMALRPTITRIVDRREDPGAAFVIAENNVDIDTPTVPVLSVREIDSVVSMRSGEVIVMGGLLQDRADSTQTGVPILSELPLLGGAFRTQVDGVKKSEIVIFLKATVVENGGLSDTDKDLYKTFAGDRRPLPM